MVPAAALSHRSAAEFTAPDHQGVIEHAPAFEIHEQGCRGLIDFLGRDGEASFDIAVVVPCAVVQLDEADSPFGESASEQAVGGEAAVATTTPIEFEGLLGLIGEIHQLGHAHLHSESEFILIDSRSNLGVKSQSLVVSVEIADGIDDLPLVIELYSGGRLDVVDGIACALKLDALVLAGEEAAVPLPGCDRLGLATLAHGCQDDEARQVTGFAADAVQSP